MALDCYVLKGPIIAGKLKFGKRRMEYLDTLRLPEFTVDLYSSSTYGYDWPDWVLSYYH